MLIDEEEEELSEKEIENKINELTGNEIYDIMSYDIKKEFYLILY